MGFVTLFVAMAITPDAGEAVAGWAVSRSDDAGLFRGCGVARALETNAMLAGVCCRRVNLLSRICVPNVVASDGAQLGPTLAPRSQHHLLEAAREFLLVAQA